MKVSTALLYILLPGGLKWDNIAHHDSLNKQKSLMYIYCWQHACPPGGSDGSRLYDCVWRYNSSVNEWTEVSPMLKAREYHSTCVLKGQLYVVASDSTERYDHALDCWEALPPMLHPMDNCSTTTCSGCLYAIGSLTGEDTMAIQSYDADTNRWAMVSCGQLPPWSFTPKTVTLKSLIYFVRWVTYLN